MGPFEREGMRLIEAVASGIQQEAHEIMAQSQIEVPKDTLVLQHSAFVDEPVVEGGAVSITFGYGRGEDVNPKTGRIAGEYALPVHEILTAYHEPPTKAKFLEDPCLEREFVFEALLGEYVKRSMTRGAKEDGELRTWMELIGQ